MPLNQTKPEKEALYGKLLQDLINTKLNPALEEKTQDVIEQIIKLKSSNKESIDDLNKARTSFSNNDSSSIQRCR